MGPPIDASTRSAIQYLRHPTRWRHTYRDIVLTKGERQKTHSILRIWYELDDYHSLGVRVVGSHPT